MASNHARKMETDHLTQLRRKADQEWEMAGLARQDQDHPDEERHTKKAREYERQIQEYLG